MRSWRTDVVISLVTSRSTLSVVEIRESGVLVGYMRGYNDQMYYDLGSGLLHSTDPDGQISSNGSVIPAYCQQVGWARTVLEQFVTASANPQVIADHLYQGLKASSVNLPTNVKFVRNYLGGVQVYQDGKKLGLRAVIDFIMKGFDKE